LVEYMDLRLDTLQGMEQHEKLAQSLLSEVREKVKAGDIQGALAVYDSVNVLLLRKGALLFFLQ
jgi:hypothetical protein